ncbi:hypothetical protein [Clostridium hydrogenum]|uniref:hypothetical protein n=1 Tax=Clostridium hydrogenum TaxID=2855764 RepID=UPI001F3190DD|nr:hypothetical protein [Clostridium hydrogenum]
MAKCSYTDKTKEECIIANKVYDQCRQQDCIEKLSYDTTVTPEVPVNPPNATAAVTIAPNSFSISNIILVNKTPNLLRRGYYDIELKFSFSYTLEFRGSSGAIISTLAARSVFNKKVSLFGSTGSNVNVFTDFASGLGNLQVAPFVLVEANAYPLDATLGYTIPITSGDNPPVPNSVNVTIGLFTIIKLFRLVNLTVPSSGFCKPKKCEEISDDPCEYFNNLKFPFDIFDPPQKEDFFRNDDDDDDDDPCEKEYLEEDLDKEE